MSENEHRVSYDAWMRRHPPHPGRHLYHGCLEAVEGVHEGLGVGVAARKLGVSRAALSRVLNGRAGISAGMALKLEAADWGSADMWMRLQADYDLARERNRIGQWPADSEVAIGEVSAAASGSV